ncbi:arsenate reductase [Phreatobacter aquaticus]|uniref:Arsenate reductase n=1 Tax=Phreatobacter aquaticus TaxID=2570229 RepID=A0A4D7QNA0_9HYPH|nr:arsenate reductase [Phreatobacter aquaticus]QCK86976.1 arsenate reductase [Phreatobacter aquaticus]
MTTTIYGIKTCDTVRKARTWLDSHHIAHRFHDFRAEGLDRPTLEAWVAALGWETVLNRQSTTFKELPEAERAGIDRDAAIRLMLAHPTLVKRPVLDRDGRYSVGFKPDVYAGLFA